MKESLHSQKKECLQTCPVPDSASLPIEVYIKDIESVVPKINNYPRRPLIASASPKCFT